MGKKYECRGSCRDFFVRMSGSDEDYEEEKC